MVLFNSGSQHQNCCPNLILLNPKATYVTQSDKTSLIARKYAHVLYNYIYLLFCVCYSNSVRFIELLRSFCIHGEACAKISCSEKRVIKLERLKINSKLLWQRLGQICKISCGKVKLNLM